MKASTEITVDTNIIHSTFPSLDLAHQWLRNHGYHKLVVAALDHTPKGAWVTKEYRFTHGEDVAILNYFTVQVFEETEQLELTFDA